MKVFLLLLPITLMVGCATEENLPQRMNALKNRGIDTSALEQELRAQNEKFALFRSYMRADKIAENLEAGKKVDPNESLGSIFENKLTRYEDAKNSVACYSITNKEGIWCYSTKQ